MFRAGMQVQVGPLESTQGMLIGQRFLDARKEGAVGIVYGVVAGHGGDVLWVKHEDGAEAAYCFTELTAWAEQGSESESTARFDGIG